MRFGSQLATDLKERYRRKSVRPKVGDSVRIVRGEFKGIEGKVTRVDPEDGTVRVDGVSREKLKGGTAAVPIRSSNVVITSLTLDDKLRKKRLEVVE